MLTPEDLARFTKQKRQILERLNQGPATNDELIAIARKYTGRISEIKKKGIAIVCEDLGGGLTRYSLAPARSTQSASGSVAPSTTPPPRGEQEGGTFKPIEKSGQVSLFAAGEDRSHV